MDTLYIMRCYLTYAAHCHKPFFLSTSENLFLDYHHRLETGRRRSHFFLARRVLSWTEAQQSLNKKAKTIRLQNNSRPHTLFRILI